MPESIGRNIQGEFRLRMLNADLYAQLHRAHPEWTHAQLADFSARYDSGWTHNVVTDYGRRFLITGVWGSAINMFIHAGTSVGNVHRNAVQFTYTDQTVTQIRAPDITTLDSTLLLQTRTVQYPAPVVARIINTVGLTSQSTGLPATGFLAGIMAFTKLSSPVTQGTSDVADLQYRVAWALN